MRFLRTFIQTHRRVRQRATRYSLLVVLMLFGLFLEAYMHNFNLVYITLFFVFAIAFSAGPLGTRNIGKLEAEFEHSGRLFANQEGKLFFRIINQSSSPAWAITLHCDDSSVNVGRVDANATKSVSLVITPQKRGEYSATESYLQSYFPLSTVRFLLYIPQLPKALVYPEPKGVSLRSFLHTQKMHFGEEKDFDGLASYSGSESLSRIHWPSVAKGEPAVKTFVHEQSTQELAFDFYRVGKSDEERLSQLTLWVLACEKLHQSFTIKMPNKLLKSKKEGIDVILEHLARY